MAGLTPDDINDIADDTGLSPREVQNSLALREPSALAGAGAMDGGAIARSMRGKSAAFAETQLDEPPISALDRVKTAIEKHARSRGHKQAGGEADIVDEQRQVVYRIRSEDDGRGGALVRVDIDPSRGVDKRTLTGMGVGAGAAALAVVAALGAGIWWWVAAAAVAGAGVLGLSAYTQLIRSRVKDAHQLASAAIGEVERTAPPALGPGDN